MDLSLSKEERAFQQEVRTWLKANRPKALPRDTPDPERVAHSKVWQRKLYDAGYLAMGWPKEYGGQGADVMRQTIVNEEMVRARAPQLVGMMGIQMLGPTLINHGTDEQRRRYLPKVLEAEEIWCQGYSEPGAGSDLASLKTRAELVGDHFVVNGQKIWTSNAQYSDWMFCLVRTDPDARKHRGISYVLIDMESPGITVRPLVQMTGEPGFNEIFFEDVHVPRENLVGELNAGWTVANSTLFHERNMLASTTRTQQLFDSLVRRAKRSTRGDDAATADPLVRQRLADLAIRVETRKLEAYRQLTDTLRGRSPGISASVNKLVTCELNHDLSRAALELAGPAGWLTKRDREVLDGGSWPVDFMFALGLIIGGGTAQIQKNIISERGLGLPREPRPMIDFGLTEEQEALQRSAREVLSAECPPDLVRATAEGESGVPRPLYAKLAELGFFGMRVPERFGGLGLETLDLALVLEELGRVCAPGPFLATQLVIDGLLAGGSVAQKKQWLPKLAAGETLGAVVLDGVEPSVVDVQARLARGGWKLDGRASYVLEAPGADLLLVAARTGKKPEAALHFLIERETKGVRVRQHEMMDLTRRFATVELKDVVVTKDHLVGKRGTGAALAQRLVDLACVGIAADSFGGAQRTIEMAVEYAKVREQFGRTIGSFQAVKHIAAEMVADVEPLRSLCWYAAWVQDNRAKEKSRLAAMAKAALGDIYSRTVRSSVEIHGGIGFTWEFDLHLWFKRAHVSETLFGDPSHHRERVAVIDGY